VRPYSIIAVVLCACALGVSFSTANPRDPQEPQLARAVPDPQTPYGVGKAPFAHRAATSCAAASCHGGGQVGKPGSEHSTWAPEAFPEGQGDPHTKAYRVLFNPVSVRMAKVLNIGEAHKAALCLKCHAVDSAKDPDTRDQILSEGVGCGACHGPADKWIGDHYSAAWKGLSNREKWEKYGFVPASNLVARAVNCAGCHVGDADRDVNHDLYAAGHPRITFEAAAFHHQPGYRKHWTEKTPQPDFEVRLWVVGQIAALRSATDLLRSRADRADKPDGIWPEFAGYSCFSCHQKIGEGYIRGEASAAPRAPGVPGWEVWSNTGIGIAAEYCSAAYPGVSSPDLKELKALQTLMGAKRAPNAKAVATQATKAVAELDVWLAALQAAEDRGAKPVPKGTAEKLAAAIARNALTKDGTKLADHDWDALASNYLGCAAMFHATGGEAKNTWGKELNAVRDGLRFPVTKGARFDSPADYDAKKLDLLKVNFGRLRDAVAPTGGN
jgi:hypothetical protein